MKYWLVKGQSKVWPFLVPPPHPLSTVTFADPVPAEQGQETSSLDRDPRYSKLAQYTELEAPPSKEPLPSTRHTGQTHHHGLLLVLVRNEGSSADSHEGGGVVDQISSSILAFKVQLRPTIIPFDTSHCPVLTID